MKRFLLPILLAVTAHPILAQDENERISQRSQIAKQSATTLGDRGLFTVPSVETLGRNQFSLGFGYSNTDRTPKDIDVNSFPLYFSYGLAEALTVTAAFDVQRQVTVRNAVQPGFNTSYPFATQTFNKDYGDLMIAGKYRIRRTGNIGGIALKGFLKIGSADPAKGLGTGRQDAGLDLIFSSPLWGDVKLDSNIGYTATGNTETPFVRQLKDELRSGVGVSWPSSQPLHGLVEYATTTYVGCCALANPAATSVQNSADIAAGVRYLILDAGVTMDAGYRFNRTFDLGFANNRNRHGWTFNLTYTKPARIRDLNNRYPIIALESTSEEVMTGGSMGIVATAFDPDSDTLLYSWTTTGGRIVGAGDKVTFDASGLAPGTYTIRATASDGRGGISVSEIDITVRQ